MLPVKTAYLRFTWGEPNKKRDPDNIAAGGRKFILDALVHSGILPNDGWANVTGWCDVFTLADEPFVKVELWETE